MSRKVVVFTGPSLSPRRARALFKHAEYRPPAKRGDLLALLRPRPLAVGIIDGEFFQSLAVTPKEVLALLEAGVPVYGAASMGALRAVELAPYGMIGAGSVYRLFRRGVLDADDEVALAYSPSTYRAVSEPLVNTRYQLRAAVRHGILSRSDALAIVADFREVYFPRRTRRLLLDLAARRLDSAHWDRLAQFLASTAAPDVKARDARSLLKRMRADLKLR
jgi:TfuA protein